MPQPAKKDVADVKNGFVGKRRLGGSNDDRAAKRRFVRMGSTELERLWSLSESNLDALSAKDRDFYPAYPNFFEQCVLEVVIVNAFFFSLASCMIC